MSKRDEKARKALVKRPSDPSYEVGYKRPPSHSQFKPGMRANPAGRPKGSKNKGPTLNRMRSILMDEAYREIKIVEGDRTTTTPAIRAAIRCMTVQALKGDARALRHFTEMVREAEREEAQEDLAMWEIAIGYKVDWERELERRKRLGISGPEPVPHPDQIILDFRNGTAEIVGPITRQERAEVEKILDDLKRESDLVLGDAARERLAELKTQLEQAPNEEERALIQTEIDLEIRRLKILDDAHERLRRKLMRGEGLEPLDCDE